MINKLVILGLLSILSLRQAVAQEIAFRGINLNQRYEPSELVYQLNRELKLFECRIDEKKTRSSTSVYCVGDDEGNEFEVSRILIAENDIYFLFSCEFYNGCYDYWEIARDQFEARWGISLKKTRSKQVGAKIGNLELWMSPYYFGAHLKKTKTSPKTTPVFD